MDYRKAGASDAAGLKDLWRRVFCDSQTAIDGFFDTAWAVSAAYVAEEDGRLAAMTFALPVDLCRGETAVPAAYLYAVATDPAFRGRGLCRGLLNYCEKRLAKTGAAALLLVPAEEELVEMYRKFGFSGDMRREKTVEVSTDLGRGQRVSAVEYGGLRETLLWDRPHLRYKKALLDYAGQGAELYALGLGAGSACGALTRREDGLVRVEEILPDDRYLPALAKAAGVEKLSVHDGQYMIKWLRAPQEVGYHMGFDFA